ncbi:MAG TPA: response regulator transcription factor [Thermomicrobiales bacterium]|nr:response regulator transcription factor [Thermomicrobiales bacterium]
MRVLVVEDEAALRRVIARGLRQKGLAVDTAPDGAEALDKVCAHDYDVVVLDRELPRVHGDDVCRAMIDADYSARILMLTGASSIEDCVEGLSLGADDYLTKPFAMPELLARIHALSRRPTMVVPPVIDHAGIKIEPARHLALRDGRKLDLTPKEFGVLQTLMAAAGRVVSAEELLEKVWDENIDPFTNVVRVTMMNLRRKLGEPPVIETITGVGYRMA